jgi:uncharacterized membrane protein YbhN (UPF0104 family)
VLTFTSASLELDLGAAIPGKVTLILVVVWPPSSQRGSPSRCRKVAASDHRLDSQAGYRSTACSTRRAFPATAWLLFGGNLATKLLFAVPLLVIVRGFGYHVGLAEILFINISVSLLAGVMPVPAGIGVVEGGLAYGLVGAGMTEEAAFAAVLLYRLATFYLPPIWGYLALRWLERNNHP